MMKGISFHRLHMFRKAGGGIMGEKSLLNNGAFQVESLLNLFFATYN